MFNNPNSLPYCVLIIGRLLSFENEVIARKTLKDIFQKYEKKPNTDYLLIWLERLTLKFGDVAFDDTTSEFVEKLKNPLTTQLFSTDWLKEDYKIKFVEGSIVNEGKKEQMSEEISYNEVDDFNDYPFK